jgi:hypothetical protein
MRSFGWRLLVLLIVLTSMARADQIEMQNGDRYSGVVMSMTSDSIVLQSEILGQIKLPRGKVSTIALGAANKVGRPISSTNNPATVHPPARTPATADTLASLSQLGSNTNLIEQIRNKFLGDAGPQATEKFDELLTGLSTGQLDINDLRAQAKSAADQLRKMKKDMGGDAGDTLDAYLDILDGFLADSSAAPTASATNSAQGTIIIR